jgi:hypothetical protein
MSPALICVCCINSIKHRSAQVILTFFMSSPASEEILTLTAVDVVPNGCPLSHPLTISASVVLHRPLPPGVRWVLQYVVDFTSKRHCLTLLRAAPLVDGLAAGPHTFTFVVPSIDVTGVKERHLLQVGLLRLILVAPSVEGAATRTAEEAEHDGLVNISMVVQVAKDSATGQLIRNIIPPIE